VGVLGNLGTIAAVAGNRVRLSLVAFLNKSRSVIIVNMVLTRESMAGRCVFATTYLSGSHVIV
jgi:hypothetical protein